MLEFDKQAHEKHIFQDFHHAMGFQKGELMKKRLLSIFLCVCLTAGSITLPAVATENASAQDEGIAFGNTLAVGEYEVSVIKADGTLWTWGGSRRNAETGDYVPVTVPEQVQDIPLATSVGMANGFFASDYSMVITADGELWNWGSDFLGRLGRASDGSRTPGKVMNRVRDVSAGYYHTAALTEDGVLWTWGDNGNGQLGNGGTGTVFECYDGSKLIYETLPVKVMTDVVSVSAGEDYTAAIRSDGSLWTWGSNNHGQLGNGGVGNAEGRPDYDGVRPPHPDRARAGHGGCCHGQRQHLQNLRRQDRRQPLDLRRRAPRGQHRVGRGARHVYHNQEQR